MLSFLYVFLVISVFGKINFINIGFTQNRCYQSWLTSIFKKTDVNKLVLTSILRKTNFNKLALFTRLSPRFC